MKKEYKTPEAEVMVFDYEENVVASIVARHGKDDNSCKVYDNKEEEGVCQAV